MAIGLVAIVFGFINDAHRAWPSLMVNNYFFLAISAFAIFFIALQYVSEAAWAIPFKRLAEGITSYFLVKPIKYSILFMNLSIKTPNVPPPIVIS